ncbi:AAA family ATPase [Variovorax sp. OV329]|uniref:AAA family ATPase n=1 Tax=Variovorax sp. OV329 TaxID=1882825 RepID=UPI000B824B9A|nr:AAA family ATPase [Variovorax sp. OV329]
MSSKSENSRILEDKESSEQYQHSLDWLHSTQLEFGLESRPQQTPVAHSHEDIPLGCRAGARMVMDEEMTSTGDDAIHQSFILKMQSIATEIASIADDQNEVGQLPELSSADQLLEQSIQKDRDEEQQRGVESAQFLWFPTDGEQAKSEPQSQVAATVLEKFAAELTCMRCGHIGAMPLGIAGRHRCIACEALCAGALAEFAARIERHGSALPVGDTKGKVQLFELRDVISRVQSLDERDKDVRDRMRDTLFRLTMSGEWRPLGSTQTSWRTAIDDLVERHPNFSQCIDENLRPAMAIRAAGGRASPPPILLLGKPGVGKSHFASALGQCLGVPALKVDMASAQSGSTLAGSSTFWSNSAPGMLFETLAFGAEGLPARADPVVFLDEVDKASGDSRYSPLGPLYSLLEAGSARKFTDEALPGLPLDASYVRWVLAANSTESIPAPLLSRVQIFEIEEPTPAARRELLRRIFAGVVGDASLGGFEMTVPDAVLDAHVATGLRTFKRLSLAAIGRALEGGCTAVREEHFATSEHLLGVVHGRPRIGFL